MPKASNKPVPTSITITLNLGSKTELIATIQAPGKNREIASVIAQAVRLIVDQSPRAVPLPQLETLARSLCKKSE